MNKEFQNDGDRLKEVLTKSIGKERIIKIFNILFHTLTLSVIAKPTAINEKVYIMQEIASQFPSMKPKSFFINLYLFSSFYSKRLSSHLNPLQF